MANEKRRHVPGGSGPGRIQWLDVTWVIPDAGAFGRDKPVPQSEATMANVRFHRDGQLQERTVTLIEADELIRQAESAAASAAEDEAVRRSAREARAQQVRASLAALSCLVCHGRSFRQEVLREEPDWSFFGLRLELVICEECGYVMSFHRP